MATRTNGLARTRRRIALALSAALIGTLLQSAAVPTARADDMPAVPASEKPLSGHDLKISPRTTKGAPSLPRTQPRKTWPAASTTTVPLQPGAAGSAVRVGKSPVSLKAAVSPKGSKAKASSSGSTMTGSSSGEATVGVWDHKSAQRVGVDGMVFSLARTADTTGRSVQVSVDYSAFAQVYGGSYASRVRLVSLPACAATSPQKQSCTEQTLVAATNDTAAHTLTAASVAVPATTGQAVLLGVSAGTDSDQGDYKATALSPSAAWNTNLNTGDFSWSYDMSVPGVPGKFAPSVKLAYSSGSVDGRTSNTNNQASWVGDGFSLWSGSIERSYKSCAADDVTNANGNKPGDMCWAYDNATLSFNGHAGELIATGTNSFRLKDDDGTKIDRIYGSASDVRSNGAHNDEYWRVTTTDGTQYYFGYNRLPGWTASSPTTNSTWTVPVYGDDAGEPCHASTFADSWCQQAWQWNLDYAVDVHGNAIAYYYNKETNTYARNLTAADETSYDRGGTLDHIDYGLRDNTVYSAKALGRVDFTSAERCIPETGVTCDPGTIDDKSFYWYDTPWDLNCKVGADCNAAGSPTFWTRKRLTDVTTSVLKTDSSGYSPIDTWHLEQGWGMADIDYQLELKSVKHTGESTTPTVPLPPVTFGYDQRTNRLKLSGDDTAPFIKDRLATVVDESGGQLDVTYSTATCDAAHLPTPSSNTTRCFPVYFTKQGDKDPTLQWFNKYVVDAVTQTDRTNSSPDMVTRYSYLDGAAWHYDDDDGLTKEKYKTWSTWRGYGHVQVETGGQDPVGMETRTDHYFLRGMDGDKGSTDPVTVSDDHGGTITDDDAFAGFEYKTEQYSGPTGKVLYKTVNTPWEHTTATRTRSWGTTKANLTGTAGTRTWTSLDDGVGTKWRTTNKVNSFENTAGRITATDDFGDESVAGDDQCTRTTYVDNTTAWILTTVSRVETVAVKCASDPDRPDDVISDVRTAYDGQAYGAAPAKGDITHVATLASYAGSTAHYTEAGATFDAVGRQLTATDITGTVTATETTDPVRTDRSDGRTTTTAYSPSTGFPKTLTTTTPPATPGVAGTAQSSTTTYDALRGLALTVVDTNGKHTDMTYDALGRNLRVWLPNRSKANNDIPNYQFVYTTTENSAVSVATKTLKSDSAQQTAYTIYDGFLRPRQTQAPGPDGGRLLTDTLYDERGLVAESFAPYYNTAPPSGTLLTLDDAQGVETQTWNTYDALNRNISTRQIAGNSDGGAVLATTLTTYGGDRTSVTPPQGATPTTTITDARGNTTDLLQYHGSTPTGTADTTHYTYTPDGKLHTLTDPAGSAWTYTYDLRGNQVIADDPDKGELTSVYDDRNLLQSTTDARKQTITHVYDGLGRETETHDGTATGPLLTKHVWDPAGYKGQLASATRYVGGADGYAYTTTYNLYDTLYRPNRTTTTIPSVPGEEALAGSYQFNTKYNANGTVQSIGYPAAGSLPADGLVPGYDDTLRPTTLTGTGGTTYVTGTTYSYTGKPLQYTYQSGGKKTQVTNTYQWGTQRLDNSRVDREDVPGTDKSSTYGYDEAGNVTSISDVSRDGTDDQCFQYDYLGRLTEAWAQGTTGCTAPSPTLLGGPASYWQSYTYDLSGNRKTETLHDPAGNEANDVHRTYKTPGPTEAHPHSLNEVDTTAPTGTSADYYGYDAAGNTQTRTIGGDQQTLSWDSEGHLTKITADDGNGGTKTVASYVYDADGNRLISRTADTSTLYLGATQLTITNGDVKPKATRYYDLGGGNQAIRTDDGTLSFLISDHLGTAQLAINATDLTMEQRRSTPFGTARGDAPASWPGNKGFIGGVEDDGSGLTHLGARDYDPATGRFISVDPVLDTSDPQQINGYSYSDNSPVTNSDPTGLRVECGGNNGGGVACPTDDKNGDGIKDYQPTKDDKKTSDTKTGTTLTKKQKEQLQEVYDYFYTTAKCFGNPVDPSPKWDVCYTQAELDAYKAQDKALLSALGDMTFAVPYLRCLASGGKNEHECDVTGEALSSGDLATLSVYGGRFIHELTVARRILCSFTPDTPVLMKDGKTKPIGKVKPGDKVATANPKTGKRQGDRRVTAQLVHHDNDLLDLAIREPSGRSATLHTTTNHPFWDNTLQSWVPAGELAPGHTLNTATNDHVRLLAARTRAGAEDMYNLTVQQLHTYYVLAGNAPVLVHNSSCGSSVDRILGELAGKRVTTGRIIDSSGNAISDDIEAGGSSDLVSDTDSYLREHGNPINPRAAVYPAAQHVEAQYAMWMRQNGVTSATVVMNNSAGVCGGPYGCQGAIREILPVGSSMTVWYPGAENPTVIRGEALAP